MNHRQPRPWTDAEREQLRLLLPKFSLGATAMLMKRSVRDVRAEADRLGIERRKRASGTTIEHLFRRKP